MSTPHWQAGKYVFPSRDGSGFESQCFASIEDAADYVFSEIVDQVHAAYNEWDLGVDGITPLLTAAEFMELAEQEWGDLEDNNEEPGEWLLQDRQARVGDWFVAACERRPIGPCNVHAAREV